MTSTFSSRLATSVMLLLAITSAACGRESATAPAAPAALRLEAVSATQLEGTVGEPVNGVPTVLVRSETGEVVPGIKVSFTMMSRTNSVFDDYVTNNTATTDARGIASAGAWMLGTRAGLHGLEASILNAHLSDPDSGAGHAIAFRANVHSAAPATLSVSGGDNQVGLPGDEIDTPEVRVIDRFGNTASGVTVTFQVTSGGGSLANTHDDARWGWASPGAWTLGPNPGPNSFAPFRRKARAKWNSTFPGKRPREFSGLFRRRRLPLTSS